VQYDRSRHKAVEDALAEDGVVVKISDFGLSMRMVGKETHVSNIKQGTAFYTAPEVTMQRQLHLESDVYSFGVVMWEVLTGVLVSYPEYASPFVPACLFICIRRYMHFLWLVKSLLQI
jgi:serine/threonine protein kinase